MTPRGRALLGRRLVFTMVVVLGVAFAAPGTAPGHVASAETAAGVSTGRVTCPEVAGGFAPRSLTIPDVVGRTRVLARGRDSRGAPLPPPLTARGRWQFAWDKTVRAGGRHGVVRLTAHTYPWSGAYGTALGNRLLTHLRVGARMVATGPDGARLCYRVTKRVKVRAHQSLHGYYSWSGPPRLAILVCSGKRRGPGDWSHRTIWFAVPIAVGDS